jgi:hypothetical protein
MFWKNRKPGAPATVYGSLPVYSASQTQEMVEALQRDGFALIPGVLDDDFIVEARRQIDRLEPIHWDFSGKIDHYKNVFNRDAFWLAFLDQDGVVDLAEATLGPDCHIIGETAWRSKPGHCGVGIHLDYLPMTWPEPGVPDGIDVPMFICTAHFYLSPQTEDLCPTHVIPRSHRAGRRPGRLEYHWRNRLAQPVLCNAGDVLYFRSDIWHAGSNNVTLDQSRYLLQVHYARREIAQHFAPYLEWQFNPDVLAASSARQLRLLGDHRQGSYD